MEKENNNNSVNHEALEIKEYSCGLILLKNFMNAQQQKQLYLEELFKADIDVKTKPWYWRALTAFRMSHYNNIFTKESNIQEPKQMLKFMNEAVKLAREFQLKNNKQLSQMPKDHVVPEKMNIDNCYTQLYPQDGKALCHVDGYLDWVVSLSIGCACDFTVGATKNKPSDTVRLNSGDVAIFNGGKVFHEVTKIHADTEPSFWKLKEVETYGFARCNVQLRDSTSLDPECPQRARDMYK